MSTPETPAKTKPPGLLAAVIGLLLAIAVTAVAATQRPLARVGNLDVSESALPSRYLMLHKTEPNAAYLVERRNSTMRRSAQKQPGRKRRLLRFHLAAAQRESFVLLHKQVPTTILLPAEALADWSYPFVHAFVRERHPDWPLASIRLEQLHVNRLYRGLYVAIELPHDPTKKQGGDGSLRTLLSVDEGQIHRFDTRFEDGPGALMDRIILGQWPNVAPTPPEVAFLLRLREGQAPIAPQTFVLARGETAALQRSPTFVSLSDVFAAAFGRPAGHYDDARAAAWLLRPDPDGEQPSAGWDPSARAELQAAWQRYLPALAAAVVLDARARGMEEPTATALHERLRSAALAGLPLTAPSAGESTR